MMATALGGVGDDAGGAGSRPRHCTRFWKEVSGGGLDVRLHGHVVAGGGQKVRGGSSVAVLSHDGTAATKEGRKRRKSFPRYGERGAPADLPRGLWVRPSGGGRGGEPTRSVAFLFVVRGARDKPWGQLVATMCSARSRTQGYIAQGTVSTSKVGSDRRPKFLGVKVYMGKSRDRNGWIPPLRAG